MRDKRQETRDRRWEMGDINRAMSLVSRLSSPRLPSLHSLGSSLSSATLEASSFSLAGATDALSGATDTLAGGVSSLVMVPVPWLSKMLAPDALERFTKKVSLGSTRVSP